MLILSRKEKNLTIVKIGKDDGENEVISALYALAFLETGSVEFEFSRGHEALKFIDLEEVIEFTGIDNIKIKEA